MPLLTFTTASVAPLSVNVTVPVAAVAIRAEMVNECPATAGFGLSPPVIPADSFATCVSTAEVDPVSAASPA